MLLSRTRTCNECPIHVCAASPIAVATVREAGELSAPSCSTISDVGAVHDVANRHGIYVLQPRMTDLPLQRMRMLSVRRGPSGERNAASAHQQPITTANPEP